MVMLFSCSSAPEELSLDGEWYQHSGRASETVVFFDGNGRGEIWSRVIDGTGLTESYSFNYSVDESSVITLYYDKGGSDTLYVLNWDASEILIAVEEVSEWFIDGALNRSE